MKAMFEITAQHPVNGDLWNMEAQSFMVPKVPEQVSHCEPQYQLL